MILAVAGLEKGPKVTEQSSWDVTRPLVYSAIAFMAIDTLIVIGKTYSRLYLAKLKFWWDDLWIVVAWALLMPLCGMGVAMAKIETDWDDEDRVIVNLDEAEILLKIIYTLLQFLLASYAATRYSILALYLRIFSDKKLRIAIWCTIAFVTVQWLVFAIQSVVQCNPVRYYWDRRIEGGTCINVDQLYRTVTPFKCVPGRLPVSPRIAVPSMIL